MTPQSFIAKWRDATLKERSAAQEHFIDLCRLLGEPTPAEADPAGEWYCFERGARKTGGGDALRPRSGQGWADVWKKGCFGWEYKGKGNSLAEALKQLQLYALALESPPLLIVSDIESIVIHTAFTNAVPASYTLALDDLADPDRRRWLKWAFTDPERLRPGKTIPELTEEAAGRFADLAQWLRRRGHEPQRVAYFLNKLLFCLFAEDVELLPRQLFTRLLENGLKAPEHLPALLQGLFKAMATGGPFGVDVIDWFNGGLFDGDDTLPLDKADIKTLLEASRLDWSAIEPSIFGTLFERGLDPAKRSQLGAHYTDRRSIMRLIDPVIREPLRAEWEDCRSAMRPFLEKSGAAKTTQKARKKAFDLYIGFLERLRTFRVLDPACGSGNFLYLALQTLKDIEHRVMLEAEAMGLPRQFPSVGPEGVHGIEVNPYAAELARVTVWIGEIQWMLKHGYSLNKNPILRPLETIEQRDALLSLSPTPEPIGLVGRISASASAESGAVVDALRPSTESTLSEVEGLRASLSTLPTVGIAPRNESRRPAALHLHHHLRNLPVPRRPRAEPETRGLYQPASGSGRRRGPAFERAARKLAESPEWVDRVPEVVSPLQRAGEGPGERAYPDRILPKPGFEAQLKKRTLTNLYNQRPAWLDQAHKALDVAVAAAYGWDDYTPDMPDQEVLRRLLALNLERTRPSPSTP